MTMSILPPPAPYTPDLSTPNGLPVEQPATPIDQAMTGLDTGAAPPEQVQNVDYPPLPVTAPPGDPFGDSRDGTADMLARIIGSIGARYSGGQ